MDKEAAEKMVSRLLAAHARLFDTDTQEIYDGCWAASFGEARQKVVSALTHTPVVKDSLTTEPKLDSLLEASKAVLDWYDTDGSVGGLYEPIEAMRETIKTQGEKPVQN